MRRTVPLKTAWITVVVACLGALAPGAAAAQAAEAVTEPTPADAATQTEVAAPDGPLPPPATAAPATAPPRAASPMVGSGTVTLEYRPVEAFLVRLEGRHDRSAAPLYFWGAASSPNASQSTTLTLGATAWF